MPASGNDSLLTDYSWYDDASWQNASVREFLASVELWCPAKTAVGGSLRRPQLPRKASEKRDSIGAVLGGEERKLREKPSWFRTQGSNSTANGSWRNARCKLFEEHDRCTLNIYVDETILQYSVYIHLLRCTDIRPADRSLLISNDCLSIHVKPGQRWLDTNVEETVFIKFPNSALLNSWIALLRSYAIAEIYGRSYAPGDGGLYRMWRQVQIEVIQARNLGSTKSIDAVSDVASDSEVTTDGVDMEVSCEIVIGDALCGRTTVKKCTGSPEWIEQFTFRDLPPFGDLMVHVYREKKAGKPHLVGSVQIALLNCRRSEMIEGWFPAICADDSVNGTQAGELRLKLKVDEEIVLSTTSYTSVLQCLAKGNLLDLLNDMEQDLKIGPGFVAEHIMAVAVARNVLMHDLFQLAEREVLDASTSHNTLFRGNSVLTKTMELAMNWYGKGFLEASVGSVIRRIISEKVAIEVDPIRSNRTAKDQEKKGQKDQDRLVYWCAELWNSVYSARDKCPRELRQIFQHIRQLIEKKFGTANTDIRWQGVSAFCFLRFIVPSILHPHLFGLCQGMPPQPVQRSLTLVAKALQSLANLNTSSQKEEFMKGVKLFHKENIPLMNEYLKDISTVGPERIRRSSFSEDEDNHIQVMSALRDRKSALPTLHREALLFLPHLLDIPKHLAILTSSVVRHARQMRYLDALHSENLKHFAATCFEVENMALKCVQQLVRPRARGIHFQSSSRPDTLNHHSSRESTNSSASMAEEEQRYGERRRTVTRSTRPSTAPGSDRRQQWDRGEDDPPPNSPVCEEPRPFTVQRKDESVGLSRRGSLEGSRSNAVSEDMKRGLTGGTHGRTESAADPLITSDVEDGKKRRGFFRGLISTKR